MNTYTVTLKTFSLVTTTSPLTITPRIQATSPQAALDTLTQRLKTSRAAGQIFAWTVPTVTDFKLV